jgi:hypothetical protein
VAPAVSTVDGQHGGARVLPRQRMAEKMDKVTMALERRLRAETTAPAALGDALPGAMGSLFKDFVTLAGLYHYPAQHFDFHQQQLTLGQQVFRASSR